VQIRQAPPSGAIGHQAVQGDHGFVACGLASHDQLSANSRDHHIVQPTLWSPRFCAAPSPVTTISPAASPAFPPAAATTHRQNLHKSGVRSPSPQHQQSGGCCLSGMMDWPSVSINGAAAQSPQPGGSHQSSPGQLHMSRPDPTYGQSRYLSPGLGCALLAKVAAPGNTQRATSHEESVEELRSSSPEPQGRHSTCGVSSPGISRIHRSVTNGVATPCSGPQPPCSSFQVGGVSVSTHQPHGDYGKLLYEQLRTRSPDRTCSPYRCTRQQIDFGKSVKELHTCTPDLRCGQSRCLSPGVPNLHKSATIDHKNCDKLHRSSPDPMSGQSKSTCPRRRTAHRSVTIRVDAAQNPQPDRIVEKSKNKLCTSGQDFQLEPKRPLPSHGCRPCCDSSEIMAPSPTALTSDAGSVASVARVKLARSQRHHTQPSLSIRESPEVASCDTCLADEPQLTPRTYALPRSVSAKPGVADGIDRPRPEEGMISAAVGFASERCCADQEAFGVVEEGQNMQLMHVLLDPLFDPQAVRRVVEGLFYESVPRENVRHLRTMALHNMHFRELFLRTLHAEGGDDARVQFGWHLAGSLAAAEAIQIQGIRCDDQHCACGRYGRGGYVATSAAKANVYADSEGAGGERHLFLVLALPGDTIVQGRRGERAECTAADLPSHPTEYCFVDQARLYCACRLDYLWIPTGRRAKVTSAGGHVRAWRAAPSP